MKEINMLEIAAYSSSKYWQYRCSRTNSKGKKTHGFLLLGVGGSFSFSILIESVKHEASVRNNRYRFLFQIPPLLPLRHPSPRSQEARRPQHPY